MKHISAVFCGLLISSFNVNAALISTGSQAGPGSAVMDTDAHQQWMKLSTTANMSINQVVAAMAPGEKFHGFRYATYNELTCGLMGRNTGGFGCNFNWTTYNIAPVWDFLDDFGLTSRPSSRIYFNMDPVASTGDQYAFGSAFHYYDEPRPEFNFDSQQVLMTAERMNQTAMHWLVRDARNGKDLSSVVDTSTTANGKEVPEPSSIALLLAGVLALRMRHKARKKTVS